jgi:hypothetical protein
LVATDVAEEAAEEVDDTEEDELLRVKLLRGTNMPRTSSAFIGLSPLTVPHSGREICGKVGGFATAVIRKNRSGCGGMLEKVYRSRVGRTVFPGRHLSTSVQTTEPETARWLMKV